ncbi:MAG: GNAT family N-acetyltransferase [Pseudomonadota bacterium]
MAAFTLRVAGPEDEAAVTALTQASYRTLMPAAYDRDLLVKVLPIICKANPALLASTTYFLAVTAEGDVIGSGGWSREQPGTLKIQTGAGHIRHFATHPDWTRRGVGRAIHERCAREARAAGLDRFECYASLNAVDFYERLGFKEVRPVDLPMGGSVAMPALMMERDL